MMRIMPFRSPTLAAFDETSSIVIDGPDDATGEGSAAESSRYSNHADCTAWTVKEEPMDMENPGLVINLTPGTNSSPPDIPVQHWKRDHRHSDGVSVPRKPAPSYHADGNLVRFEDGNIPAHLQNNCSDSETSSQEGLGNKILLDNAAEMVTGTFRFSVPKTGLVTVTQPRAKREFVPDFKKDDIYWNKRQKNNVSARLSRIKRKTMEKIMEQRLVKLEEENLCLKRELEALKKMFGDKVSTDLSSAHSGSPVSSPSSGLGTSTSSLSSGGSAEHTSCSSPDVNTTDEDKAVKVLSSQVKETLNPRDDEDAKGRSAGEQQSHFYGLPSAIGSTISPPPAHRKVAPYIFGSFSGNRFNDFIPPAAHGSYHPLPPYPVVQNNPVHLVSFEANNLQSWPCTVTDETVTTQSSSLSAGSIFPPQSYREGFPQSHRHSSSGGSSEGSPVPCSSSSGMATSEDDSSNISSDLRKTSTASDPDEESLERMRRVPLKHRMKMLNDIRSFQNN